MADHRDELVLDPLDLALRGDVARHRLHAEHPLFPYQLHVLPQPELAPVAGDRRKLPIGIRDLLAELFRVELGCLLVKVRPDQVEEVHSQKLVLRVPHAADRHRICVGEESIGVGAVDDVVRGLHELPEALFTFP